MKTKPVCLGIVVFLLGLQAISAPPEKDGTEWWPADVERALDRAGDNRPQLLAALRDVPAEQRKAMAFLIANMPDGDLKKLRGSFLLDNVALAARARQEVPWGRKLPEEIFLEYVLPYANVDEERHAWRKELYELCLPLVKSCKTPGEAAQRLNGELFKKLRVRYSTERKKPHQSPQESMASGKASCTGLSILLSDACRSVAVPARLVGTPLWKNMRGNHTWVEVWDDGWHFTGACEADPQGLDHAWFEHDASKAVAKSPVHAIYAARFRRSPTSFPLVWNPHCQDVPAENVTARYTRDRPADERHIRVMIRVRQAGSKKRLTLPVVVEDRKDPKLVFRGESHGENADRNDFLTFVLSRQHEYILRVGRPVQVEKTFQTSAEKEQLVEVETPAPTDKREAARPGLLGEQKEQIEKAARDYFAASAAEQARWRFDDGVDKLLLEDEEEIRRLVWQAYRGAPIHTDLKKDFEKNQVRHDRHLSPYTLKKVGTRPQKGWPLFIAMHGGGNAPRDLNDSQWKIMQIYYRDQPAVGGYKYLALRAPNDTWNGFYDDYVPPLIINLIRQMLLFGDVDPDRVYLMGYSHGGYGAFFLGPKIPDHFAAVHSSAAAPTDGAISPRTLRNTRFTYMVGEKDTAFGRRERCEAFDKAIRKLQDENKGDYPVVLELKKGYGHGGLPDRDKLKDMAPFTRNPVPRRLSWDLTDSVVNHFFWLSVPRPGKGQSIDAAFRDNKVEIRTRNVDRFELCLDSRLVDFRKPLRIEVDGKEQTITARPQLAILCRSLAERGDPQLASTCRVSLQGAKKRGKD